MSELTPPDDKRCEAMTKAGPRCSKWIVGVRYCERHRHLEATNGGPGASASVTSTQVDHGAIRAELAEMPLETTGDAHALLAAARRALILGVISDKTHGTFVTSVREAHRIGALRDERRNQRQDMSELTKLSLEELAARTENY